MTYEEATQLSLKVKWKIEECPSGQRCWCRLIVPEEEIRDKDGNEIYIAGSGSISKTHAEHIVAVHNRLIANLE